MKKFGFVGMMVLGLVLMVGQMAQAQDVQLIQNGGFETWSAGPTSPPDHWAVITSRTSCTKDSTTIYAGSYSGRLDWDSTGTRELASDTLAVTAGQVYTCSLWVYDNDPNGRVRLWFNYTGGSHAENIPYTVDSPSWQMMTWQDTVPTGTVSLNLEVRLYSTPSTNANPKVAYVDDVVLWGPPVVNPLPSLQFYQLSFILGNDSTGGYDTTLNSDWGHVDLTYVGQDSILYFNLTVDTGWVIQNVPVLSEEGTDVVQTITMSFPITSYPPPDTPITSIQYAFQLTDTSLSQKPQSLVLWYKPVDPRIIQFLEGPLTPAQEKYLRAHPVFGEPHIIPDVPNNRADDENECAALAVCNGLNFLNNYYGLGLDSNLLSLGSIKSALGWSRRHGCPDWAAKKAEYVREKHLPFITHWTLSVGGVYAEIGEHQAVELLVGGVPGVYFGHVAIVTGIVPLRDPGGGIGGYAIDVAQDTRHETIIYDCATNTFIGSPPAFDGKHFACALVECPGPPVSLPPHCPAQPPRNPHPGTNPNINSDGWIPRLGVDPYGTEWLLLPQNCSPFQSPPRIIDGWDDVNSDSLLSPGDDIRLASQTQPPETSYEHVENVTPAVEVIDSTAMDTLLIELLCDDPLIEPIVNPDSTFWYVVCSNSTGYDSIYVVAGWLDLDWNSVLSNGDLLYLTSYHDGDTNEVSVYLTQDPVTEIITSPIGPPPCAYLPGDINGDNLRGGGDVTYGVRFFKLIGNRPPDSCYMDSTGTWLYVAGDVNGNCEFRASDITRLVAYFKLIAPLQYCHFFPPPPAREEREIPIINQKD